MTFEEQLAQWHEIQNRAIAIGHKRKWAKEVRDILRQHLCYTAISLSRPDQVLARLLILIDDLTKTTTKG